ncbi:MAG: hypothetical protein NTZ04_06300 [Chloroflexi bacterium]|nr:hypothetical protein [Chloroflexota bacterium]
MGAKTEGTSKGRTKGKKQGSKPHGPRDIHGAFRSNLESLEIFVGRVAPIAKEYDKATSDKVLETLEELIRGNAIKQETAEPESSKSKVKPKKGAQDGVKIIIDHRSYAKLLQITSKIPLLTATQIDLLYKSSLVMLLSYFDFLVSDLIHCYYQSYPESLSDSEKDLCLRLDELRLCSDLTEAMNCVVNKEVDKVLRDNLETQKKYLKQRLGIELQEDIVNWHRINEAIERRNLIVHNNSKINRFYLKNADISIAPEKPKDLREGKQIGVTEDYFSGVFNEIYLAGVVLLQSCWRHWRKDDIRSADGTLLADCYDALCKQQWNAAERICLFGKQQKISDGAVRLGLDVNYCQSLKWQNRTSELQKQLATYDMSTLSPMYKLALCALESDRDGFYANLPNAIIVDEMEEDYFAQWPLFRELREDPDYEQRVKSAFMSIPLKGEGNTVSSD